MDQDPFVTEYRAVSTVLLEYGCMVAPNILGGEWRVLRECCDAVRRTPPPTPEARAQVERQIDELLTNCAYHPNYRAFGVYRAMTLPHLKEVSHLIERGVIHYFKQDFLSCTLCLLPAVEGVLRSRLGPSLGGPRVKFEHLVACVHGGAPKAVPDRHGAYADAITAFLDRWLYRATKDANFELSFLNRHYALHALGGESFYRATDCHRLLLFFDVFADLLNMEGHGEPEVFLPDHIDEMNRRRDHYEKLVTGAISLAEVRTTEDALLREHLRFVPEERPPVLEEVVMRWAQSMRL
jgi:hypothetical protein